MHLRSPTELCEGGGGEGSLNPRFERRDNYDHYVNIGQPTKQASYEHELISRGEVSHQSELEGLQESDVMRRIDKFRFQDRLTTLN